MVKIDGVADTTGLLKKSANLSDLTDVGTARTNLGLGSAALSDSGDFDTAGTAAALVDDLSGVTDAITARTNLGLGSAAVEDASAFDAVGSAAAAQAAAIQRANHTGTQTADTISDFDTEVAGNADVTANTSARHTHANQAELDLITDGDHDVRADNPHAVTAAQVSALAIANDLSDLNDTATARDNLNVPARGGTPVYLDAEMACHFDGPAPYETDFSGSALGHRGQSPMITGPEVYRPGKFDKSLQVAEATVNYVLNPVSGAAGNITTRGSATVTASSGNKAFLGVASTKVAATAASGDGVDYTLSALTNAIHSVSVALDTTGLTTLEASLDGSTWHALTETGEIGGWYVYKATNIPALEANGSTTLAIRQTDATVRTYYVGAAQVEAKAHTTPICYGDMPSHTWAGTPHASTSSRAVSLVGYDVDGASLESGTIMFWVKNHGETGSTTGTVYARLFSTSSGDNAWVKFSNDYYDFTIRGLESDTQLNLGDTINESDFTHVAFVWGNDGADDYIAYYINGELGNIITGTFTRPMADDLYIGRYSAASQFASNWLFDELVVCDSALDAALIRAIYESDAPVALVNRADTFGAIRMPGRADTPPLASGAATQYFTDDGKLVYAFNDSGTIRYKYLDLTGTGVTWVHTTTAP